MSEYTTDQIRRVVQDANVYCSSKDMESIRIDYTEWDYFLGTGEESGEEYQVFFEDIDLDQDSFYKLVSVDIKTVL